MSHVFNMGIGMVLIVSPYYAQTVADLAAAGGLRAWVIGQAVAGTGKSRWA